MVDAGRNLEFADAADVRYIVTGAAGHLGSTVMRCLQKAGCEVNGLLLPGENPKVLDPGFRYFHGNICDIDSIRCLFQETDGKELIVIHTAALISIAEKMPQRLHDVNVDGVRNVLALCREYGVRRLVHVSSVHAIPELPDGQVMREPDRFSAELVNGGYAKTKAEAAQAVLDAAADGLNAVVVFPSGILGPYDEGGNHLVQMIVEYLGGKLPACIAGGYDFVDVRDVARGCVLAAARGRSGEGYILSGNYLEISRLLALAADCSGGKEVPVIPTWLAKMAVPFIQGYSGIRHRRPLYTRYSLRTLTGNGNFSNDKAVRELGYSTREPEETVSDMVSWLVGAGLGGRATAPVATSAPRIPS